MSNKLDKLYVGGLINRRGGINTFSVAYLGRYDKFKLSSGIRLPGVEVSYIDKDYVLLFDFYNNVGIILNRY